MCYCTRSESCLTHCTFFSLQLSSNDFLFMCGSFAHQQGELLEATEASYQSEVKRSKYVNVVPQSVIEQMLFILV